MNKYLKTYIRNREIALVYNANIERHESTYISEETKIKMVQNNFGGIRYIPDPSEEVQLAAVQQSCDLIRFIKNPSEKVQLVAVQQNENSIQHIQNPTQKVKDLHKKLYG